MDVVSQKDCQMTCKLTHSLKIPIKFMAVGNQVASWSSVELQESEKDCYLPCKSEACRRIWKRHVEESENIQYWGKSAVIKGKSKNADFIWIWRMELYFFDRNINSFLVLFIFLNLHFSVQINSIGLTAYDNISVLQNHLRTCLLAAAVGISEIEVTCTKFHLLFSWDKNVKCCLKM